MIDLDTIEHNANSAQVDIEDYQRKLLVNSLRKTVINTPAYHVYTDLLDGLGHDNSIEILRRLPTLTKQEVLENSENYHRVDFTERKYPVRTELVVKSSHSHE